MTKCEVTGCGKEMSSFHASQQRKDGVVCQILNTGKIYIICTSCVESIYGVGKRVLEEKL